MNTTSASSNTQKVEWYKEREKTLLCYAAKRRTKNPLETAIMDWLQSLFLDNRKHDEYIVSKDERSNKLTGQEKEAYKTTAEKGAALYNHHRNAQIFSDPA